MPRVSVAIPAYNHEKYIAETIESILNQTYQDFEIIIVDDKSPDNTVEEIKKFKDNRIKLFCSEENQGVCVGMNKCIEEANGEFIAFVASDDIFMPRKLEKQVKFLDENKNIHAVFSYPKLIDENGKSLTEEMNRYYQLFIQDNKNRYEWLNHFFYFGNCLLAPSILIRKECFEVLGEFDLRYINLQDYDMWIRLCMKFEIHIIPEKLVGYRVRLEAQNLSGIKPGTIIRSEIENSQILRNFLEINKQDYMKIFKSKKIEDVDEDLIPFLVAKEAVRNKQNSYKYFGIETIYNMVRNKETAEKLKTVFNFKFSDLLQLTSSIDVFNLLGNDFSTIFIDVGNGYCEDNKISQSILLFPKEFSLEFNLGNFSKQQIKAIRWDPIEGKWCKIKLSSIIYIDSKGQEKFVDLDKVTSNGVANKDGSTKFNTFDPIYNLNICGDIKSISIKGQWEFRDYHEIEAELNSVYHSIGWRVIEAYRSIKYKAKRIVKKILRLIRGLLNVN